MQPNLLPSFVSLPVAGRLLAFVPPSAFAAYRAKHPAEFGRSTERRIALADIAAHPRRDRRKVTVGEYLAADRAEDGNRERYRRYNAVRKHAAEKAG
jgi:hypothetical protein